MKKQTKRLNNNKRKTRKYYGGNTNLNKNNNKLDEKSKGILDIIGSKLYNFSKDTGDFVAEKGLRLIGLQPIKKDDNNDNNNISNNNIDNNNIDNNGNKVNNKIDELGDASSGMVSGILSNAKKIGSDVVDVVDKSSAALVGQVNDVLESPKIENSIGESVKETADIGEKILGNVNEILDNPILKKETEIALENVGDYAEIAVDALNKPLNKGIDNLNEAGTEALGGVISGAIKVGTDALAAVPGLGAVVEVGKIVNDASKAIGDVVEAGTDSVSTVSEIVKDTNKNIHEGIEKLDETKNSLDKNYKDLNNNSKKISNRIDKSIKQFENPVSSSGGRKTRNKILDNKYKKTKRVRFSI